MKYFNSYTIKEAAQNYSLGYMPSLDGIRGIAIILVLLLHANVRNFSGGFYGVDLFFVLSGYLITSILMREFMASKTINFCHFYRRRVLRLFPALAFMCFSFLCFAYFKLPNFEQTKFDVIASITYVSNWTRAFELGTPFILGHTWSLAVEEQFYLVWPLSLYLLLRRKSRSSACICALLVAALSWGLRVWFTLYGYPFSRTYNGFDTHCDAMFLGTAFALAANPMHNDAFSRTVNKICYKIWPFAVLGAVSLIVFSHLFQKSTTIYGFGFFALFSAVIVVAFAQEKNNILTFLLRKPLIVYVGRISYGVYLWHFPVFIILAVVFGLTDPYFVPVSFAFVFGISILSYHFLEVPLLKLRYLPDNKFGRLLNAFSFCLTALSMTIGFIYFFC